MFRGGPFLGGNGVGGAYRISMVAACDDLISNSRSVGGGRFRQLLFRIPPESVCIAGFGDPGGTWIPGVASKKQDTGHRCNGGSAGSRAPERRNDANEFQRELAGCCTGRGRRCGKRTV